MMTHELMNKTLSVAESGSGVSFEMPKSNRGIVHMSIENESASGGGAKAEVHIQGRLSPSQGWVDINLNSSSTFADLTATIDSLTFQDIQVFPEMRANISTFTFTQADVYIVVGN